MSLEVLLIPLGLAAIAAINEARSNDLCEKCKATRITDSQLLLDALQHMGVTLRDVGDARITGISTFGNLTFQRVADTFVGRVDGASDETTLSMLSHLDETVGRITQLRTADRLRVRAQELGLTLLTERAEDGTMQFVFEQA